MALDRYRQKRDFTRTPEPAGAEPDAETAARDQSDAPSGADGAAVAAVPSAAGGCRRFVVHRHRARRLHYDLRLEIDGALVSSAPPQGPIRDPTSAASPAGPRTTPSRTSTSKGSSPPASSRRRLDLRDWVPSSPS